MNAGQVRSEADSARTPTPWGELHWLVSNALVPGATQTLGIVRINPGQGNPLHLHPNCEELLYVLEGTCIHQLGDDETSLGPGDVIVIPAGVPHRARCTSDGPLRAVISFSSGERETTDLA